MALARAIVRHPRLLLLDEPLSNLDAALREEMRTALKLLQQRIGVTTVYVTHDQSEALDMSDLIAVMRGGQVVQLGTPQDIYFRPRSSFVASFVGAANLLQGQSLGAGAAGTVVQLVDGTRLDCVGDCVAAGTDVVVSVRPESIVLMAGVEGGGVEGGGAGANQLSGQVVTSGFLGSVNRYGVLWHGQVLQVTGGAAEMVRVGSDVVLRLAAGAAVVMAS